MANFAVAASQETIERANRIMEVYAREGEKKEEVLLRILDIAESNSVRGTHPELEPILASVDATVATLIKQINGIVAGQDSQMQDLKGRIDAALEEKEKALGDAAKLMSEAKERSEAAEIAKREAEEVARSTIDSMQKELETAVRECETAREIAAEKTENNRLLVQQMGDLRASCEAKMEALRKENERDQRERDLQNQLEMQKKMAELEAKVRAEFEKKLEEKIEEVAILKAKLGAI